MIAFERDDRDMLASDSGARQAQDLQIPRIRENTTKKPIRTRNVQHVTLVLQRRLSLDELPSQFASCPPLYKHH